MKFTFQWLKMYLDTQASLDEIVEKLTLVGLEVESVEDRAKTFAPFVVAHVVSAEQHPNADRLRVCMVDTVVFCLLDILPLSGYIPAHAPASHLAGCFSNLLSYSLFRLLVNIVTPNY
jgi:hypothetical protein